MALSISYFPAADKFELRGGSFRKLNFVGSIGADGRDLPFAKQGDFFFCVAAGTLGDMPMEEHDVLVCIETTAAGRGFETAKNWAVLRNPLEHEQYRQP